MKTTKTILFFAIWLLATTLLVAQQIAIPRIDQMPNKPSTYKMLDWKKLGIDYNNLVFDTNKTGQYLPLSRISESDGINYPEIKNIRMQTFVGQSNLDVAEAINIIPAVVGASLLGVDKTTDKGINWVVKLKDFFNKKNGQNLYLNGYSSGTGDDWWYEIMPNVYFYQLYSLYPDADPDFSEQMVTIAEKELAVLYKLGGKLYPWTAPNMNYRGFNHLTEKPNADGVPEPEAAGSIAWLLYQAYLHTSDARYKEGVELALSFLQSWTSNPSYELQLPYGIVTAARINAEMGTNYDVDKFLNWAFSSGSGSLRNWGVTVGKWNGYDMSGLIGEANDAGDDYAFVMNGFQQAAALSPVAKYDKRYAKALGKWILNLASASRHFYPRQLPDTNQEPTALQWASTYDPNSCIPYEAMKQKWQNKSPYSMGDAFRNGWAGIDLSLYSGSSVGYMASLISTTNVEGILQIDLNKTDFGGQNTYPNYLYYNPNSTTETITLHLPLGNYAIYDAISETVLNNNVSGSADISMNANDVRLLVIYPSESTTKNEGNMLKVVGGGIIDFHSHYSYNTSFRIKSFSASSQQIEANNEVTFNCLVENAATQVTYKWYINNTEVIGETNPTYKWIPTEGGIYKVKSVAIDNGNELSTQELEVLVLGGDYVFPEISALNLNGNEPFDLGSVVDVTATINISNATIMWACDGGVLQNTEGLTPKWILPTEKGFYTITLTIKNILGEDTFSKRVQVKDIKADEEYAPIVYYSFDGNTKNVAQNNFDALSVGATLDDDARSNPNSAYHIDGKTQYIHTANAPELNFVDQMTLSFWIKPDAMGGSEQYVISHGSWENRYKVSITPEKKLVMTLNTSNGIIDMADETPLADGVFHHFVIVYNGSTLDMYHNGELVNSRQHSGTIGKTSLDLTLGRMNNSEANVSYKGIIDEFRLYDVAVSSDYAKELYSTWAKPAPGEAAIKKLTVNGIDWNINDKFVLECGDSSQHIPVAIEPTEGATVDIGTNVVMDIADEPSVNELHFKITSSDGKKSNEFNLRVEKRFEFTKLVSQKWNNLLTVNNNAETNGGYNFTAYKWFKNGELIGTKQYYSAGKNASDHLEAVLEFSKKNSMSFFGCLFEYEYCCINN